LRHLQNPISWKKTFQIFKTPLNNRPQACQTIKASIKQELMDSQSFSMLTKILTNKLHFSKTKIAWAEIKRIRISQTYTQCTTSPPSSQTSTLH